MINIRLFVLLSILQGLNELRSSRRAPLHLGGIETQEALQQKSLKENISKRWVTMGWNRGKLRIHMDLIPNGLTPQKTMHIHAVPQQDQFRLDHLSRPPDHLHSLSLAIWVLWVVIRFQMRNSHLRHRVREPIPQSLVMYPLVCQVSKRAPALPL